MADQAASPVQARWPAHRFLDRAPSIVRRRTEARHGDGDGAGVGGEGVEPELVVAVDDDVDETAHDGAADDAMVEDDVDPVVDVETPLEGELTCVALGVLDGDDVALGDGEACMTPRRLGTSCPIDGRSR